jgi:hypothetical protein
MLAKPLMLKCWQRRVVVDTEDVGKGPCAKGVDEGDIGVDTKDVREAPCAKILMKILMKIFFVVDVREAPLAISIKG